MPMGKQEVGSDSSVALEQDRFFLYRWVLSTVEVSFLQEASSSVPQSGNKESPLFGGFYDYWLVRADAFGNKQWDRSYWHGVFRSSIEEVRVARGTIKKGYIFGGYVGGKSRL